MNPVIELINQTLPSIFNIGMTIMTIGSIIIIPISIILINMKEKVKA